MTEARSKVLIIDDEPNMLDLLDASLSADFDVDCQLSAQDCLSNLSEHRADIVLLDVNMPEIDGYEACRQLRKSKQYRNTPIVFISAETDLDAKLKGYDAGGDDYIAKPFDVDEITAKIKTVLSVRAEQNKHFLNAKSMAKSAISEIAEVGVVLNFCEKMFNAESFEKIATALLESLSDFDLNCCVKVHADGSDIEYATGEAHCQPMESELLTALIGGQRIQDLGVRAAFSFKHICLLVKNMPTEDSGKCGRLRDHIALMLNAAESRADSLIQAQQFRDLLSTKVKSEIARVVELLKAIAADFSEREMKSMMSIERIIDDVDVTLADVGLSLSQCQEFTDHLDKHLQELLSQYPSSALVEEKFAEIAAAFQEIVLTVNNEKAD